MENIWHENPSRLLFSPKKKPGLYIRLFFGRKKKSARIFIPNIFQAALIKGFEET